MRLSPFCYARGFHTGLPAVVPEPGNLRSGDSVAGFWHRRVPGSIPAHRRAPAATAADRGSGSPLRALPPGIPGGRPAHHTRHLAVPAHPANARRRSEPGGPDRRLQRRTRGNHLPLRSRDGTGARAIRFRKHVRHLRPPCRLQAVCSRATTTNGPAPIRLPSCPTTTGRGVLREIRKSSGEPSGITNNLTGTRIYQIVGVAEAGFTGTEPGKVVDIFLPAMMHWGMAYPAVVACSGPLCTCNRAYRPRRCATT